MKRTVALLGVLSLGLAGCTNDAGDANTRTTGAHEETSCSYPATGVEPSKAVDPPSTTAPKSGTTTATIEMAAGTIRITMDRARTPCTINSFASLAGQDYFNDTRCHRLVDSGIFILQCGDPSGTGRGGPGYSFADELSGTEKYPAGTVAMANAGADTNGSQFFLVYADTELPASYTVFGTMDEESTKVVAQIASQGVDAQDGISPIADASIKTVTMG